MLCHPRCVTIDKDLGILLKWMQVGICPDLLICPGFFSSVGVDSMFGVVRRVLHCFEHLLRGFGCQALVKDRQVDFLLLGKVDFDKRVHTVQHAPQGLCLR